MPISSAMSWPSVLCKCSTTSPPPPRAGCITGARPYLEIILLVFNSYTRRLAELGGCRSRWRVMAQARSSATAGACPCGNETNPSPNKRGRNGLSLSMLSRRPIQLPPLGRNDCGPGGRRGTIPYHTIPYQLLHSSPLRPGEEAGEMAS
jgi:hypothetical protein